MRFELLVSLGLTTCLTLGACADDGKDDDAAGTESGDGDGDGDNGDGDGDNGDGDGEPGDGDGEPGDGDGEPGDGDGEPGDGDGEPGDGDGDAGNCATTYETCEALQAAFAAETASIRGCSDGSECGQDLVGTSCGCTNNWVARIDADTDCFYALIDQAGGLECDLGLASDCSCPAADGFVCAAGTCTWNYL